MKAFNLFLVVLTLSASAAFSQGNATAKVFETGETGRKPEGLKVEASLSPQEQAERDLLVPRKYQVAMAENAAKPIVLYGPSRSSRKSTSRYSKSRRGRSSKKHGTVHHRKSKKSVRRRR